MPFQPFYGDEVYERDAAGVPQTLWRLPDELAQLAAPARDELLDAARRTSSPAPEYGPGFRRSNLTGEVIYSADWLGGAR